MDVSENSGFSPKIIHFNRVFHYKPSILGYPYFWKHPYIYIYMIKYITYTSHPKTSLPFCCIPFFWYKKKTSKTKESHPTPQLLSPPIPSTATPGSFLRLIKEIKELQASSPGLAEVGRSSPVRRDGSHPG